MADLTPGERAAELLVAEKETLARALTDALYRDRPELLERYGEYGRTRCHEDMRFNLEHLAPALALDKPDMFAGYVRWLHELLVARNVDAADVERSLEVMKDVLATQLDAAQTDAVARCVDAGLAELRAPR